MTALLDKTLPQVVLHHAATHPASVALRQRKGDAWVDLTWQGYAERARNCAAGLLALGLEAPRHVAVFANNRVEWVIAQIGTGLINGITIGCYPTSSPADLRHALGFGDVQVLFCENAAFLEKIDSIRQDLPQLRHIILMDGASPAGRPDIRSMPALESEGATALQKTPALLDAFMAAQSLDDVALMVYTSGSTGAPKAAMLTYGNMRASAEAIGDDFGFGPDVPLLSYLPLCHIAEQCMTNFAPLYHRSTVAFGGSLPTLLEDLRVIRPGYFSGVPRVWLRLQAEIIATFKAQGRNDALMNPDRQAAAEARAIVGMDRAKVATSGGAALHPDILSFFRNLGFPLQELFGQTESCGTMTFQRPDKVRPGTVGEPTKIIQLKLAEDGEVLVRGENVFRGYYKNPEATASTITDGWLHTGDIGRLDDGQLRIVDRKKDIMITDGGKNIAPAEIEGLMRTSDFIQECVLVADGRKYAAALIQIEPAAFGGDTYESTAAKAETAARLAIEIRRLNEDLARVAQVKRAFILPAPLRYDLGDLTPTLKLRRFMVHQRYLEQIEAMYRREIGFDIYADERA